MDGGQILRSLLWFAVGRARSLMVASAIGFIAVGLFLLFAIRAPRQMSWLILMSVFVVLKCWNGLRQARAMARMEDAPRRADQACPNCRAAPPIGLFWTCARCRNPFDFFASNGMCLNCGAQYAQARCAECGQNYNIRPGPTPV